ncbi:hypothetical protein FQR65_LT10955 [Abscondita terminalis]|nr:hypothetical protein FQR65_LT10955 [Abscondita terminalis]
MELPEEIQTIAKNELNEIPEQIGRDISYIREWLLKQPHIRARTDDYSILKFLRACKFSLEKTKNKLELFYTIKTAFPDTFKNRDPLDPKIQYFFRQNIITMLPRGSLNGPLLFLCRVQNANADIITLHDFIKVSTIMIDTILQDVQDASVVGQAVIYDLKNVSTKFYVQSTPTILKQAVTCLQDAYPIRVKAIHYINVPKVLFSLYTILKSFFPKKIQERVTCDPLSGENSISSYFSLSVLPTEYGGTAGSFADLCEKSRIMVESYRQWFIEDEQYRCIDEKRPVFSKLRIDLNLISHSNTIAMLSELPKEIQIIARNELNEIPERVGQNIAYIREWLLKQPHIHARTDNSTLLIFLRNCKFSLEKTKSKIDSYYSTKTAFPELFKNRDPFQPKFQYILKNNIISLLPRLSKGPVLILARVANGDPDIFSVEDALKFGMLLTEIILKLDIYSNIVGHVFLIDFKDLPIKYFIQLTPTFLRKLATCFVNVYPVTIKAVHIINLPLPLVTAANILKSFLSSKLQNKFFIYVQGDLHGIQQHFPSSVMPTEYGGEAGPFGDLCAQFKATVESYREWIIDDEQYLCIEEKRQPKHDIDSFSVDGSFRKLEID